MWSVQGNSAAFEMEYCCTDLGTVLRAARAAGGGALSPAAVKDLMHQLMSGLRAVHETGSATRCPGETQACLQIQRPCCKACCRYSVLHPSIKQWRKTDHHIQAAAEALCYSSGSNIGMRA